MGAIEIGLIIVCSAVVLSVVVKSIINKFIKKDSCSACASCPYKNGCKGSCGHESVAKNTKFDSYKQSKDFT